MIIKYLFFFVAIQFAFIGLQAQNQFYIDPTASPGGDGSINFPFDSVSHITWQANSTYFFKRGTITTEPVIIEENNVTLDAYGEGALPLVLADNNNSSSVRFFGDNGKVKNMHLRTADYTTAGVIGFKNCKNGGIYNSIISNANGGINTYYVSGTFEIINTTVHTIGEDGLFLSNTDTAIIDKCHVYDVNLTYNDGIYGRGNGDGIQTSNVRYAKITNTVVDREGTNNKFSIILQGTDDFLIDNCQLYGSDVIFDDYSIEYNIGMYTLYLSGVGGGTIKNSIIYSGVNGIWNQWSANITVDNCLFYGQKNNCIDGAANDMVVTNCLFYKPGYAAMVSAWGPPVTLEAYNNIFYTHRPIAASAEALNLYNNLYYPVGIKDGRYDSSPIPGSLGENYNDMYLSTTAEYKVVDRRDTLQKYLYVNGTDFFECYYFNNKEDGNVRFFFDVNKKAFVLLPLNSTSYKLKMKDSKDNLLFSGENLSQQTQVETREWVDSVCSVNLFNSQNQPVFNETCYRLGPDSLYYPGSLAKFPLADNGQDFLIYYNQFKDRLIVNANDYDEKPFAMRIYNLQGNHVKTVEMEQEYNEIAVPELRNGAYIVTIYYNSGLKQFGGKFVKF